MKKQSLLLQMGLITLVLILTTAVFANAEHPWAEYGKNGQNSGQSPYTGPTNPDTTWSTPRTYDNSETFVAPIVDSAGTTYFIDSPNWSGYGMPPLLKAIDKNGGLLWEKELHASCLDNYSTASIALGTNGLIYAACGFTYSINGSIKSRILAFNAANGSQAWEYILTGDYEAIAGIGNIALDSTNNIYFSHTKNSGNYWWETYRAVTSLTGNGAHRWTTLVGQGWSYGLTGPMLSPDEKTVYLYYMNGQTDPGLASMSSSTGNIQWNFELPWGGTGWPDATSSAVAKDGTIWLVSYRKEDNTEYCYRKAEYLIGINPNGYISNLWPLEGDINCGSHISVGPSGTIYVSYDTVTSIDVNGATYYSSYWNFDGSYWKEQLSNTYIRANYSWNWNPDTSSWELVIQLDDSGIPVKFGGLSAFTPGTGVKWRFNLPNSFEHNAYPAVDAAENIYFTASYGHKLYSLNKDGGTNWIFDIAPGEPDERYQYNAAYDTFPYAPAPAIGPGGSINILSKRNLYVVVNPGIPAVISAVNELLSSGVLNAGQANSIISKLIAAENANNATAKANMLQAAINQINALARGGILTNDKAAQLTGAINQIQ